MASLILEIGWALIISSLWNLTKKEKIEYLIRRTLLFIGSVMVVNYLFGLIGW